MYLCAVEVPVPGDCWALLLRDCCKAARMVRVCGRANSSLRLGSERDEQKRPKSCSQSSVGVSSVTQRLPIEGHSTSTLAYSTEHLAASHVPCKVCLRSYQPLCIALILQIMSHQTTCQSLNSDLMAQLDSVPWSFCLPGTESNYELKSVTS